MKALLLGDMSPTITTNPLFERGETKVLFTDTLQLFEGNDINFVNLECAITESDTAIKKFGPPLSPRSTRQMSSKASVLIIAD